MVLSCIMALITLPLLYYFRRQPGRQESDD
jgi:hypothetical protein